jgi:hypothetical protein
VLPLGNNFLGKKKTSVFGLWSVSFMHTTNNASLKIIGTLCLKKKKSLFTPPFVISGFGIKLSQSGLHTLS